MKNKIKSVIDVVVGGMVRNKSLPKSKKSFEEKCVGEVQSIIDISVNEIKDALYVSDGIGFGEFLDKVYNINPNKIKS